MQIPFLGLNHQANTTDGQFSVLVNLNPDRGSGLLPVAPPKVLFGDLDAPDKVYIHGDRYLLYNESRKTLSYITEANPEPVSISDTLPLLSLTAIGNILICSTPTGLQYFRWNPNAETAQYVYLGNKVPTPQIDFSLCSMMEHRPFEETLEMTTTDGRAPYPAGNQDNFTAVMGWMNKYVADITGENKFLYPFFVCCAVCMYDGSYINITTPTLLIPNSGYAPILHHGKNQESNKHYLYSFISEIACCLRNSTEFEPWQDIVTSIDFFVSQQVFPYNQAMSHTDTDAWKYDPVLGSYNFTIGSLPDPNDSSNKIHKFKKTCWDFTTREYTEFTTRGYIKVAPFSEEHIANAYRSLSFNLLSSVELEKLSEYNSMSLLKIPEKRLSTIATQPSLDFSTITSTEFSGARLLNYNSRLHVVCDALSPVEPALFTKANGFIDDGTPVLKSEVCIHLKTSEGIRFAYKIENLPSGCVGNLPWYYYPDTRAYLAEFTFAEGTPGNITSKKFTLPLKPHPTLPGAYFLQESQYGYTPENEAPEGQSTPSIFAPSLPIPAPSSVYVSEPQNPFVFSASSALTVGEGDILALASASRPLSQGQFGQFPLYTFTTEGVWALETTAQGTYSARQPITRDICISADSICSLDSSVLFATRRGIMQLSGSEATCISDQIQLPVNFDLSPFVYIKDKLPDLLPPGAQLTLTPSMLAELRMLYDYPGQRVIAFTPGAPLAFSLNLRSGEWSMVTADLHSPINSYPDALALDAERRIVTLSSLSSSSTTQATPVSKASRAQAINPGTVATPTNPEEGTATTDVPLDPGVSLSLTLPAVALTAPLTLGDRNMLKTIRTLLVDGSFDPANVKLIIYGSRDLRSWQVVTTRSTAHIRRTILGTGYRYFRIAILTAGLSRTSYLTSATLEATPRPK